MALRKQLIASLFAASSALGVGLTHAADHVTSGSPAGGQAYGRAGGLVGAERIALLRAGTAPVTVVYGIEFVSRTNLPTDRVQNTLIGITWDAEYVGRTNMPREGKASVFAQTRPGRTTN